MKFVEPQRTARGTLFPAIILLNTTNLWWQIFEVRRASLPQVGLCPQVVFVDQSLLVIALA